MIYNRRTVTRVSFPADSPIGRIGTSVVLLLLHIVWIVDKSKV